MPDVSIEKPVTLDLIETKKPGTSATSDVPIVETRPDASPKAATEEVTTQEESASPETPEGSSASDAPKKPAKGVQKRLDELTRQREDERRARLRSEELLQKALDALNNAGKPKAEETGEQEPPEPDVKKYTDQDTYNADYRKYLRDLARWEGRQGVKAERDREREESRKQGREQAKAKAAQSFYEKARAKFPDFDDVVNDGVPITDPMVDAVLQHEMGPDIAYHLGSNPSEASRIARLSPAGQLMELGLIAASLRTPVKPPVSQAPKPIKPLTTGSSASPTSKDEESMDAYAARRAKELAAERARPGGVRR
jgi:hypothetical protein